MKSKSYLCMRCKSKFSRKWNAFRHNLTVHSNLAEIVSYSDILNNTSLRTNHPQESKNFSKNKFQKINNLQSKYESQEDDDYIDLLIDDENNIDSKIMKIIGQMLKPYRELESSLNGMDTQTKAIILSNSFTSSLLSYNPAKSLSEIADLYRSTMGLREIAQHCSVARNIPIHEAAELIIETVRNSSLIRRMNN